MIRFPRAVSLCANTAFTLGFGVIIGAAMLVACESTTPTSEPFVEANEALLPVSTRVASSPVAPTPTVEAFVPPDNAIHTPTPPAPVLPLPPVNTTSTTQGVAATSSATPSSGSTLLPGPTRTPNSTESSPPTFTPRVPTATLAPNQPSLTPTTTLVPGQPSATPTRTPTRTPTQSPTPTGTTAAALPPCNAAAQRPAPTGWAFNKVCIHPESENSWAVYGEFTNNTGGYQQFVEITAKFYNTVGSEIAFDTSYPDFDVIPNGVTLRFVINVYSNSPPAQYGFEVLADPGGDPPRQDLQKVGLQLETIDGFLHLTGQIRNSGPALTDYAALMAAFYSADGKVVAIGYAEVYPEDFLQGSASFQIMAEGLAESVTSFGLVVLGY